MSKYLKTNKNTGNSAALKKVRRNIYWQAGLALVTIVLTVVIIFAMTSAWYTNIVQTSGLVFQAEAWGFDGTVTVRSQNIVASPGDEGIIHMEAKNTSDSISAVSITASKTRIEDPEMRKRLYVYVDTQMMRNEENMNRVYLNTQESYTYTLFSQGKLTLTEQLHSDAQLKWQWVYDVLGYYVLCSYNKDTGKITEIEYLRPVEYNYDEATTTFEESKDGTVTKVLKTVDGETTVEEFLEKLSETDGYEEDIDYENPFAKRYYPVDVDLDTDSDDYGYGVYVYLYNFAEIEQATAYDTKLGAAAAEAAKDPQDTLLPDSYEVVLTVSAQKNDENVLSVSSLAGLNEAMELGTGATIQLTNDIAITDGNPLVIPKGTRVMLDLNGHKINSTATQNAIEAKPGSSLTLINGEIVGSGSGRGVYAVGAEVVLSGVKLNDFSNGVYVSDSNDNNAMDSRVRIVNCELSTTDTTVFAAGNGLASAQKTQIVIENSSLYSDAIVVSGNGDTQDNGRWGTDIQIIGSRIISNSDKVGAGIYHPQKDSTLTISNKSTVSGYTGIAIKGGSVYVDDSTISGTGDKNEPGEYTSGFADTGDAIYVETNYNYEILLEISGNSVLTSAKGLSLQVYKEDAKHVTVRIISGVFDEPPLAEYIDPGSELEDNVVTVRPQQ